MERFGMLVFVVMVLLMSAACGGKATSRDPGETTIETSIKDGEVVADSEVVEVPFNERVTVVIRSDVEEQVHLHGYDLTADIRPGKPATLRLVADTPGQFLLEAHDTRLTLLTLRIQ